MDNIFNENHILYDTINNMLTRMNELDTLNQKKSEKT